MSPHKRQPARLLGDARSAADPGAAACSPDGGKRRRTVGEAKSGPKSPRVCRIARDTHEGAPKQRSAARFRGGRKSAQLLERLLPVFTSWRTSYVALVGVGVDAPPNVTTTIVWGANARWVFPFPRLARVRHDRRPARSLGNATSEAEPPAAACSPGGGQRRRTAGEARSGPMSPRPCRSLRDLHEGTPKQRSAAGLRGRRKTARLPGRRMPPFYSGAGRAG